MGDRSKDEVRYDFPPWDGTPGPLYDKFDTALMNCASRSDDRGCRRLVPTQKCADASTTLSAAHATLRRQRQNEVTGHIERRRAAHHTPKVSGATGEL